MNQGVPRATRASAEISATASVEAEAKQGGSNDSPRLPTSSSRMRSSGRGAQTSREGKQSKLGIV